MSIELPDSLKRVETQEDGSLLVATHVRDGYLLWSHWRPAGQK